MDLLTQSREAAEVTCNWSTCACYYRRKCGRCKYIHAQTSDARAVESAAKSQVTAAEQELTRLNARITQAKSKTPFPVYQSLPASDVDAYAALFFLHQGRTGTMALLAQCCFSAQQMLLPTQQDKTAVALRGTLLSWSQHMNSSEVATYGAPARSVPADDTASVLLKYREAAPEAYLIKLRDVEDYTHKAQGVWYPAGLQSPQLAWHGGPVQHDKSTVAFDPFAALPVGQVHRSFTEPGEYTWWLGLPTRGLDCDEAWDRARDNQAYAQQAGLQSKGWTRAQWACFAGLRSYPFVAISSLCRAVRDRILPWNDPAVRFTAELS